MARHHMTENGPVAFTTEEEAEWDAREAAHAAGADTRKAAEVRQERNTKLAATDWTQTADVPQAIKDGYVTYRQALRDVPLQNGFPWTITWPDAP